MMSNQAKKHSETWKPKNRNKICKKGNPPTSKKYDLHSRINIKSHLIISVLYNPFFPTKRTVL